MSIVNRLCRYACALALIAAALVSPTSSQPLTSHTHITPASYTVRAYRNTNGFDTCEFKSQQLLSDFWNGTPFWNIGVYLGGSVGALKGCNDGPAGVDRALNTGYGVVLYWYGPQLGSPCNMAPFPSYISLNTTTAFNQGVTEAKSANTAATNAGLPGGTEIFYDMEAYYANSGCRAAAKAFINGWDHQLNAYTAFWGAAYGSACASYVSDWASIANVPIDISPSDVPNGREGSAYNFPCLNNSLWSNNQRVGQYYTHSSTHNGLTLPIDDNCADANLPSLLSTTESNSCSVVN